MPLKSLAILTSLAATFTINQTLSASVWTNRPIEQIAVDADVIVIARPLFDQVQIPKAQHRYHARTEPDCFPFVVSRVLFGKNVKPEQLILVENNGNNHLIKLFRRVQFQTKRSTDAQDEPNKPIVQETLIFLHTGLDRPGSEADYQLVYDGIRILSREGDTYVPGHWGSFHKLRQPQNPLLGEDEFKDTVRRLSHTSPTIQFKRRLRRIYEHGPEGFSSMSADLQTWQSPEQSVFGIPILSQNIGEPSDPQEDLPPVQPQADQP